MPGLSADVRDFRVARMLDDTVGVMEVEGRVGVAGDGPFLVVE